MEIHSSSSDELDELATAFALEAPLSKDRDCNLAHLAECDLCRQLVKWGLPTLSTGPVRPPGRLFDPRQRPQ